MARSKIRPNRVPIAAKAGPAARYAEIEARAVGELRAGRLEQALALVDGALSRNAGRTDAARHLLPVRGMVLRALKRHGEAVDAYEAAFAAGTEGPNVRNNFGNALRAAGRAADAEEQFRRALALQHDYPEAWHNLGLLLLDLLRKPEAEKCFRQALEFKPDHIDARLQLALLLGQFENPRAAIAGYSKILAQAPNHVAAHLNIGIAYRRVAEFDKARAHFERANALSPNLAEVKLALATLARDTGDAAAAARHAREVLAVDPRATTAYQQIATLPGYGLTAAEAKACAAQLLDPRHDDKARARLCFALGEHHQSEKRYDAAFHYFERANTLERKAIRFDLKAVKKHVEECKIQFAPEFFAAREGWGSDSRRPIFIFGLPRSGTTLVEQILSAHPDVAAGGECVHSISAADRIAKAYGSYPLGIGQMGRAEIGGESEKFLAALRAVDPTRPRTTDKLPFNFRHLGLLATLFPKATFIHCLRDPRDIAISSYFISFQNPVTFSYDLNEFGQHYLVYEDLMQFQRKALPINILDVHYEHVARNPQAAARAIVAHAGLSWDDRCLSFYERERAVHTASAFQVRSAIYTKSIGRWQRYARHLAPLYEHVSKARYFENYCDIARGGPQNIAPSPSKGATA